MNQAAIPSLCVKLAKTIGIKGTIDQLLTIAPAIRNGLESMLAPLGVKSLERGMPVEIFLNQIPNNEPSITALAEKIKQLKNSILPASITIHVPLTILGPWNLAIDPHAGNPRQAIGLELVESMIKLQRHLRINNIDTRIVIHGYAGDFSKPYEDQLEELKNEGTDIDWLIVNLRSIPGVVNNTGLFIENSGIGPMSDPKNVIRVAKELGIRICVDVAHLVRRQRMDKFFIEAGNPDPFHEIIDGVTAALIDDCQTLIGSKLVRHWHIVQSLPGPEEWELHLGQLGAIDFSRLAPIITDSLLQDNTVAITEVNWGYDNWMYLPVAGSLAIFYNYCLEHLIRD